MCQQAVFSVADMSDDATEWNDDSRFTRRKPTIEDLFDDLGPDFADTDLDYLTSADPDEDFEDDPDEGDEEMYHGDGPLAE